MGLDLNTSQQLAVLVAVILAGVIYTLRQIPHKFQQQQEGERIIGQRVFKKAADIRAEFKGYFDKVFRSLVILTTEFFAVNALLALAINTFIMSHPNDPVFTKVSDWPFLRLPPLVVSAAIAFMMCSAGWMMIVSLFYHNRTVKARLETRIDPFVTGEQESPEDRK